MTTTSTLRQRLRGWPGGVALMIVGIALAIGGLLSTTSSHFQTTDCPTGSTLVSKYNHVGNAYVFEKPAGNASVVTISQGSDTGGAWTATRPISAVILKGGPNSVITSLTPPQTSGAFSNTWLPKVGNDRNYPDVSNVQFCGSNVVTTTTSTTTTRPPTTTTTRPPTTTTRPPTTTTRPPTTTTRPPTTTTRPPTTTTAAPTTTTRPPTTTTAAPTTTTRPPTTTTRPPTTTTNLYVTTDPPETTTTTRPPTTTTAPGATTTTRPGATTTTTRPGSTTTVVQVSGEELTKSTSPVTTSTTIVDDDVMGSSLPRTGASSGPLIGIGLALLLAGAAMTIVAVRRDRA